MQSLVHAARLLRKSPSFTLLALLCLGLGIGMNTTIFSLFEAVYLRPLPVNHADRVVVLSRGGSPLFPYTEYRAMRDRNQSLEGLVLSEPEESDISFEGTAMLIGAEPVTANYAPVLGARTAIGRWFSREDVPEAVISYRLWQQLFHGDPAAIGKTVRSESHAYSVVGVAAPEFAGTFAPLRIDLWVPFRFWAGDAPEQRRGMVLGTLKPGVATGQAAAELDAIATQARRETPDLARRAAPGPLLVERVRGIPDPAGRRQALPVLTLLTVVVTLVLLIACMNVGNLLVARGIGRQREIAVRLALGASRVQILRQLMTENLLLGLLGGAVGVGVAYASNRWFMAALPLLPFGESFRIDLSLNLRVLLYSGVLALLTAVFFGLWPALQSSRETADLKGNHVAGGRLRLRTTMLAAQVALSLVLLLTAGLFARLVSRYQNLDPGFATTNRLFAPAFVPAPQFTPQTGGVFYEQTLARLRSLPGVRSASMTTQMPMYAAGIPATCVARNGDRPAPATSTIVDRGFLDTLRIPRLEGRDFAVTDTAGGPPVAIVNQTLARQLWPNTSAVGRTLQLGCERAQAVQVVGVTRDSKVRSLNEAAQPHIYLPFSQAYQGGIVFLVMETADESAAMLESIRQLLASANPEFRSYGVRRLSESLDASFWQARFEVWVLGVLGTLGLLLASIGMYGVLAYHVTVRTREIGIRVALGARPRDVIQMVVAQGLRVTLCGIAAGLALAALAAGLLKAMLPGVSPTDTLAWSSAVAIWLAVALLASWLPARRATHVQPVVALREE